MNLLHRVSEEDRLRARCERLIDERDAALDRIRRLTADNAELRQELRITKQVLAGPGVMRRVRSGVGPPDLRLVKP